MKKKAAKARVSGTVAFQSQRRNRLQRDGRVRHREGLTKDREKKGSTISERGIANIIFVSSKEDNQGYLLRLSRYFP